MRKVFYTESGIGLTLLNIDSIIRQRIINRDYYPRCFSEMDKEVFNKKYVVPYKTTLDKLKGTQG
ncbi:MAG: hypothetical protein CL596_05230 [Alteromonas sp.]|nr:hypothetical protein [Alteromonas sp.]|tara:strand:- start:9714 stop:9908 length:195 start_codon:yes stop_codon:yes gene_type:complete